MINIFYKNKKSKLSFGDRVAFQNDNLFKYGGSNKQTTPRRFPGKSPAVRPHVPRWNDGCVQNKTRWINRSIVRHKDCDAARFAPAQVYIDYPQQANTMDSHVEGGR